jgi:xanthine dehydrogenase accessory factor
VHWLAAVEQLRTDRLPGVLVTLVSVRGHAPRDAGAKMVVAAERAWGSIGGGTLEATAVDRARAMIANGVTVPEQLVLSLNERAPVQHGQQCCGGEVSVLLEPLTVVPSVAIFGLGHVGLELARVLCRHDLELHLVDGRKDQLEPGRLTGLEDAVARIHVRHAPVPELVLGQVPKGTHVLIMTHDHAEDAALCDAALRCSHLGSIGLIGSSAKWRRFEQRLAAEGHSAESLRRITSPIGAPGLFGKSPAEIALAVAVDLLEAFQRDRAAQGAPS